VGVANLKLTFCHPPATYNFEMALR